MTIWIALAWITLSTLSPQCLAEESSPYDQYYQKWITSPKKDPQSQKQLFYNSVQKEKTQENANAAQEQKKLSKQLADESKRAAELERAKNPNMKIVEVEAEDLQASPEGAKSSPTRAAPLKPSTPSHSTAPSGKVESGTAQEAIIFTGE